jgi:hypothetical protein
LVGDVLISSTDTVYVEGKKAPIETLADIGPKIPDAALNYPLVKILCGHRTKAKRVVKEESEEEASVDSESSKEEEEEEDEEESEEGESSD